MIVPTQISGMMFMFVDLKKFRAKRFLSQALQELIKQAFLE